MNKIIPLLLLTCLACFNAQARPSPPEYLAIGHPGQIFNLAEARTMEVLAYDGDSRELVFAMNLRLSKVDSVTDVLSVLNETEIHFGTDQPLRIIELVIRIYGKNSDPAALFIASDSLLVATDFAATPVPGGVSFQHDNPVTLELNPGRFPLRLKEFQKAYHLSSRNWETAYEASVMKQQTLAVPPSSFISAFAVEQDDQTFLYDLVSGELKMVRDERLDPEIRPYGIAPRNSVRDFAAEGPYRYAITEVDFRFRDIQLHPSTAPGIDFTYESGNLVNGPPIFTFAENTDSVRIRVRETQWNSPHDFIWYTTLDRIRQNKGFEVLPYIDQEGGMELPAPAGETVFYWVQARRKLLPPLPPPPPPSSI